MEKLIQALAESNADKPLADIKIRYGYALLRNEFFKLVLLLCFYSVIGKLLCFLFLVCILFPIRIYSGGLHMKSNLTCFLFTFGFSFSAIFILPQVPLPAAANTVVCCVSLMVIAIFSPFSSPKKPITTTKRFVFFREMSILFTSAATLLIFFLQKQGYGSLALVGQWTICLQAVQLVLAHILKERNKENV